MSTHLAPKHIDILLVEDNPADVLIAREALSEARLINTVHVVEDGVSALAFLRHEGRYAHAPRPGLILLDLNLPKLNGREVLAVIKDDPSLRSIPVVVLTTSKAEEDILRTYDLGVSSFISKPVTFDGLVDVVRTLNHYWIEVVELPSRHLAAA